MNYSFVICTEKGKIEKQSVLLCLSLRLFGGNFSNLPIYSFSPRKGQEISSLTRKLFDYLGVIHENINLNEEFQNYPLANKPLTCNYAARKINSEKIIFCDSDKIFLNEPSHFVYDSNFSVFIRPVDYTGIAWVKGNDSDYWQQFTSKYSIKGEISTTIDKQTIFPYFNSGLIVNSNNLTLFQDWEDIFKDTFRSGVYPPGGNYYIEQSTFAVAVQQQKLPFSLLPEFYNIPVHDSSYIKYFDFHNRGPVSIHYHHLLFNKKSTALTTILNSDSYKLKYLDNIVKRLELFYKFPKLFSNINIFSL